ncbi:MAG: MipA/OmpV family protein, partial [Fusobacterium sp.]|nr:MipA/OmpV family protein [Fusobacterium sp.]
MKKYLLTMLALFSVVAVANDDFKASVTAAYGTRTSIYKGREENAIPIFPNLSYQNLYLKGTEVGFKFLDYSRFNSTLYVDLLDGHSIKGSRMDTGYESINRRRYQQAIGLKADVKLNEISENLTLTPSFSIGNRGSKTGLSLSYLYMPKENIIISPSVN